MTSYKFSRRIGRGGMAEVFLAMQEGIGGFEKLVVVKRIFRHFCEDEQFIQMFLDEARLAASLRHPNVVEILDIRKDEDGFFIVMEYLSGETLAFVWQALVDLGATMPVAIACRIGAAVAAGLHSAHSATDVDGNPQPIIHRDVTPSNVIVCYNGVTKIVDFGVAKAKLGGEDSNPGTLKGKLGYLAPEQVDNREVDARTDVFQLGVVLHELVTGRRLFRGETDHATMTAVLERTVPRPSSINPEVPEILDVILMEALRRDPEERTASADALRRSLEDVLRELGDPVSASDVAEWMQATLERRYHERTELERECTQQMRRSRPSRELPALDSPFDATAPIADSLQDLATVLERPTLTHRPRPRPAARSSRRKLVIAVAGAAAAIAALGYWQATKRSRGASEQAVSVARDVPSKTATNAVTPPPLLGDVVDTAPAPPPPPPQPPPSYEASIRTEPTTARIEFNGADVGEGAFTVSLPRDGTTHRLRVSAPGYEPQSFSFRDIPPPAMIRLARLEVEVEVAGGKPRREDARRVETGVRSPGEGEREPDRSEPAVEPVQPADDGNATSDGKPPKGTDNLDPWADR